MEKILSIIIPTYNMEKYLHKTLSSLIVSNKEQLQSLEVLIINDGSKDLSSQIGHFYEKRYPDTFRVIDKENGNYGSCINRGLKEATGKYIKILDADDFFDTIALESFIQSLQETNTDMVITDFVKVDENGHKKQYYSYAKLPHHEPFPTVEIPYNSMMWMHAVTYRTQMLRDIHYHQTEGISYTDQEWIFLPINAAKTCSYVNICLYYYLVGRNGQTMDPKVFAKNITQEIQGLFVMIDGYDKIKDEEMRMRQYLHYRIMNRLSVIYKSALLDNGYKYFDILEFESKLREKSNLFYSKSENITVPLNRYVKKFKIVKEWRNCQNPQKFKMKWAICLTSFLTLFNCMKQKRKSGRMIIRNACP